jgi:HAD superfamily hydrolase (TIGR01662 family)
MTIQGVIFDLGSTLVEFKGDWLEVFDHQSADLAAFLIEHGVEVDHETFTAHHRQTVTHFYTRGQQDWIEFTAEHTLRQSLAEFGQPDVSDDLIKGALAATFAYGETLWQPFIDVYRTLDALKAQGYRLAIVSNARDASNVERMIDNARLRPWFDPIVISANVGVRKPNPRIFRVVLEQWRLPPDDVVMVGDMLGADILGAHNAGLRGIWATMQAERGANDAHADTIIPEAEIQSLSELPGLLQRWNASAV